MKIRTKILIISALLATLPVMLLTAVLSWDAYQGNNGTSMLTVGAYSALLAFAFAIISGHFSSRMFTNQFRVLTETISATSESSDLITRIPVNSQDEFGETSIAINRLLDTFQNTIRHLSETIHNLKSTSEEMRAQTNEMQTATETQQSETQQVAVACEQMVATMNQIAQNSEETRSSAENATQAGQQGESIVRSNIESTQNLSESVAELEIILQTVKTDSENIGSVLSVIGSIAEQTNLLALNAAIEAARAGESGRGFAVVADEVRVLAQGTSESTDEIRGIIQSLQSSVLKAVDAIANNAELTNNSVAEAEQTGAALSSIAQHLQSIDSMSAQIRHSISEQRLAADEINHSIVRVNNLAQDTNQLAHSAAQFSDNIDQQSTSLDDYVSRFTV